MWVGLHLDFPEVFEEPARSRGERAADRYGRWSGLVRELAGHDHEKAQRVVRWPLREALHAYRSRMRDCALEDYRHRLIVWAITAPYTKGHDRSAPGIPKILRDMIDGDA
jgi:hypothetical protein